MRAMREREKRIEAESEKRSVNPVAENSPQKVV